MTPRELAAHAIDWAEHQSVPLVDEVESAIAEAEERGAIREQTDLANALVRLEKWKKKGRKFTVASGGHYMPGDGVYVELKDCRSGRQVIVSEDDGRPLHTIARTIMEALDQWGEPTFADGVPLVSSVLFCQQCDSAYVNGEPLDLEVMSKWLARHAGHAVRIRAGE